MAQIFIKHDFNKIAVALSGVSGKSLRQAVSRSIKRVSKSVAKTASQAIRQKRLINMQAGVLKQRIRVFDHASAAKPVNEQYGEVHISGRPESLARFFGKTVGRGKMKRVVVSEQGRPYLDQGRAFILNRGQGRGKVILARTGQARLPVVKLTGPSIGRLAENAGILGPLQNAASDRFEREFEHNLDFYAQQAIDRAKGI